MDRAHRVDPLRVCRALKAGAVKRTRKVTEDPTEDRTPPASSEEGGIEGVRAQLLQEHDRYLRTRADFENYRRRVERDREVAARQA